MKNWKELLKGAAKALFSRYFINILIVFLVGFLVNGGYVYSTRTSDGAGETERRSNFEVLEELVIGLDISAINVNTAARPEPSPYTRGYLSVFVNEITASGSAGFGIINGINKIIFGGRIASSVIIIILSVLSVFFLIFVRSIIIIGSNRYFLEQRVYKNTSPDRLFFVYRTGSTMNAVFVMLVRQIKQLLWNITIIGGFIKHYEYLMIPYVLAENPHIRRKEAFQLSRELMKGYKGRVFLMDLSLLPLAVVNAFTLGLFDYFFINPLRECLYAELYVYLRGERRWTVSNSGLLGDEALFLNDDGSTVYHDEKCPAGYSEKVKWLDLHYDRDYTLKTCLLFFFFFGMIGWVWEVIFYLFNTGNFVNRGTLYGPWLPIYGVGGLLMIVLLRPLRHNPALLFIGSFIVCGIVEYTASWGLELITGQRWWDYTGYFMNINGRVCLEGLMVFGMGGIAMTYFLAPLGDNIVRKITPKAQTAAGIALVIIFCADLIFSIIHPNVGEGITTGLI